MHNSGSSHVAHHLRLVLRHVANILHGLPRRLVVFYKYVAIDACRTCVEELTRPLIHLIGFNRPRTWLNAGGRFTSLSEQLQLSFEPDLIDFHLLCLLISLLVDEKTDLFYDSGQLFVCDVFYSFRDKAFQFFEFVVGYLAVLAERSQPSAVDFKPSPSSHGLT